MKPCKVKMYPKYYVLMIVNCYPNNRLFLRINIFNNVGIHLNLTGESGPRRRHLSCLTVVAAEVMSSYRQ